MLLAISAFCSFLLAKFELLFTSVTLVFPTIFYIVGLVLFDDSFFIIPPAPPSIV